tara:strand:+ start:36 stop:458 length:423 start_codon:yes stop_codon:yes gene_type:complete
MNELDIDTISNFYFPENEENNYEISENEENNIIKLCESCLNISTGNVEILDFGNLNYQGRVNYNSVILFGNNMNKKLMKICDFITNFNKCIVKKIKDSNLIIKKKLLESYMDLEINNLICAISIEPLYYTNKEDEVRYLI